MTRRKLYIIEIQGEERWEGTWWTMYPSSGFAGDGFHPVPLRDANRCLKAARTTHPKKTYRITEVPHDAANL